MPPIPLRLSESAPLPSSLTPASKTSSDQDQDQDQNQNEEQEQEKKSDTPPLSTTFLHSRRSRLTPSGNPSRKIGKLPVKYTRKLDLQSHEMKSDSVKSMTLHYPSRRDPSI